MKDRTTQAWTLQGVVCRACASPIRCVPDNASEGWPATHDLVAFCTNEQCANNAGECRYDQDEEPEWSIEK